MRHTIYAAVALILIGIVSIVPWSEAQQKPTAVIIWCQDASGNYGPCLAGNSLDYDTGAGTVDQGTVGIALPGSGGPVAGGTSTNPVRIDPTGSTTQPVNVLQMNGVTVLMGAGNTGTGSQRVTEATDSQLSAGVGATGDAAATAGGAGSINAKLRLLTDLLNQVLTELGQKTEPANNQNITGTVTSNIGTTNGLHLDATFTGRFPSGFASADNIAGQTATFMHGGLMAWDSGGSNWDRVLLTSGAIHVNVQNATLAVTQSGTWTVQPGNTANTTAWLFKLDQTGTNNDVDVTSLPALPAGNNNIGDVDVASLPALPTGSNTIGNVNPGTASNWGVYTEDAAETAGGNLSMAGTVRRDTAASSAGATGDNATLNTDANGLAWTRTADPCTALAKTYIPINISTATTTELTASLSGASTHYYVCSINIGPVAGAQNVALVDDDSDGCGSVTSGLAGGTTAGSGWNIAANGGLVLGNGQASIARTGGTNRVLCLVTSASVQTSGIMTVVAAP